MSKKVLGIVLIVVGAGLAYWGYSESQALASRLTIAVTGDPGDRVMIKSIAGAAAAAAGAFLAFFA
jgi:hypothetical protein